MKVDSYKCDCCGVQKGESNHWFKFTGHPDQFSITDWSGSDYTNTKHLCSDACVIKTVQGWLSEQKELSRKKESRHDEILNDFTVSAVPIPEVAGISDEGTRQGDCEHDGTL